MKARFATRIFAATFLPVALMLCGSFWTVRWLVEDRVKDSLRTSLRQTHEFTTRVRAAYELRSSRMLSILAENAAIKAGMVLLRHESGEQARRTVDDQLAEVLDLAGFDVALTADTESRPNAGVRIAGGKVRRLAFPETGTVVAGLAEIGGVRYSLTSVPVNSGEEHLGFLLVGREFSFAEFSAPTLLTREGKVVESNLKMENRQEVERQLLRCAPEGECEIQMGGETYLSLPVENLALGNGYRLRSLQSVDAASAPLTGVLRVVFFLTALVTLLTLSGVAVASARGVVRPLTALVDRLRDSEQTGILARLSIESEVREVDDLTLAFNRAAASVLHAQGRLTSAYFEFIQTITNALDARDVYTAGHSLRVSEYSCAIARQLGFDGEQLDSIRVGALLHDVGKIGIPDRILQKPDKLTRDEFAAIQQHPTIGRRILESVEGFRPYLDVVELHHENHDGSGYPKGLRGAEIPIDARIVHVADAYDAMTSDRPYRRGMDHDLALRIIQDNAGTQFDPASVEAFLASGAGKDRLDGLPDLATLAQVIQGAQPAPLEKGITV